MASLGHNKFKFQVRNQDQETCLMYPNISHNSQFSNLTPNYRKTSNIRRTLVGNKIVDHSDVVGASPVGAAPTTASFST